MVTMELDNFSLEQICDSGQCFRMKKTGRIPILWWQGISIWRFLRKEVLWILTAAIQS